MQIKINNSEEFLDVFSGGSINIEYLSWIDPFGVAMLKAYADTNNESVNIDRCNSNVKGYITTVIGSSTINESSTYLLQKIGNTDNESVADFIIKKILLKISNGEDKDDIKQYLRYMITEMIDNVVSHACSTGYDCIAAQYYPNLKKIQVAIVDSGIGLMNSLKNNHNPNSEVNAIYKALEQEITGSNKYDAYGNQKHAGLGLFFLKRIIEQTEGNLLIISNDTMYSNIKGREEVKVCEGSTWSGTAIVFEFFIDSIDYEWSQIRTLIHNEVYSDEEEGLEEFLF